MSGNNAAAAAMQFNPYFMYQLQMAQALGKKSCKYGQDMFTLDYSLIIP